MLSLAQRAAVGLSSPKLSGLIPVYERIYNRLSIVDATGVLGTTVRLLSVGQGKGEVPPRDGAEVRNGNSSTCVVRGNSTAFDADDLGDLDAEIGFVAIAEGNRGHHHAALAQRENRDLNSQPPSQLRRVVDEFDSNSNTQQLFGQDELREFNDEISGFIGPLGDPDFDLEIESPERGDPAASADSAGCALSSISDDQRVGVNLPRDYVIPVGELDKRSAAGSGNLPSWEPQKAATGDRFWRDEENGSTKCDDKTIYGDVEPSRSSDETPLERRRLTLADHPYTAAGGVHDEPSERTTMNTAQQQMSRAQLQQQPPAVVSGFSPFHSHGSPRSALSAPGSDVGVGESPASWRQRAEEGYVVDDEGGDSSGRTPRRGGDGSGSGEEEKVGDRTGSSKRRERRRSVLVLNGAACFIRGQLSSTGELADGLALSLESTASDLDLSLSVFTSNSETDLLDRICGDDYDAIVYNPAGFGGDSLCSTGTTVASVASAATTGSVGCDGMRMSIQQPFPLHHGGRDTDMHGVEGLGVLPRLHAVEYAIARARCPVIRIVPRESYSQVGDAARSIRGGNHHGFVIPESSLQGECGVIAGFSGTVSYTLAMAAVARLLEESRECPRFEEK